MFVDQWLDEDCLVPGCEADLNGASGVNATDFAIFAANWGDDGAVLGDQRVHGQQWQRPTARGGRTTRQDGDSSDWIEIYNPTRKAVALGGWHLTNDIDDLAKWEFPGGRCD